MKSVINKKDVDLYSWSRVASPWKGVLNMGKELTKAQRERAAKVEGPEATQIPRFRK